MWMDVVTALWANAVGVCGGLDGSCCNPLQMQRCIQHDRGHHWDLPRWDKYWNEDLDLKRGLRTPPERDPQLPRRSPRGKLHTPPKEDALVLSGVGGVADGGAGGPPSAET